MPSHGAADACPRDPHALRPEFDGPLPVHRLDQLPRHHGGSHALKRRPVSDVGEDDPGTALNHAFRRRRDRRGLGVYGAKHGFGHDGGVHLKQWGALHVEVGQRIEEDVHTALALDDCGDVSLDRVGIGDVHRICVGAPALLSDPRHETTREEADERSSRWRGNLA